MNPVNKQWPSNLFRGFHPHPACGHLLPEGEGMFRFIRVDSRPFAVKKQAQGQAGLVSSTLVE
jgi:hypothetical protein